MLTDPVTVLAALTCFTALVVTFLVSSAYRSRHRRVTVEIYGPDGKPLVFVVASDADEARKLLEQVAS